jgi:23S rRNA (pseudouridine1915-N3)-methyltransferase
VDAALLREAEGIEFRIPKNCIVIALAVEGRELDSPKLAEFLKLCGEQGKTHLCFIIGGSMGLAESVKKRADLMLSMSRMTFPHHLARVMLLEQIYRAYKINQGAKYHK